MKHPPEGQQHHYKVIMVEDGSTISAGFTNAISAAAYMRNHKHYSILSYKDWKVVRDFAAESQAKAEGKA